MSPARIHTVLQCKDSKEIRLLHRHWYIQSIPIESNFVLNNNAFTHYSFASFLVSKTYFKKENCLT